MRGLGALLSAAGRAMGAVARSAAPAIGNEMREFGRGMQAFLEGRADSHLRQDGIGEARAHAISQARQQAMQRAM